MLDIITIGSALQDIFCEVSGGKKCSENPPVLGFPPDSKIPVNEIHRHLGGGGVNTAIVLAKLGIKVMPFVKVGQDKPGEEILERLSKYKIQKSLVKQSHNQQTGLSVQLHDKGEGEHLGFNYKGASDNLNLAEVNLPKAEWLYVTHQTGDNWREDISEITKLADQYSVVWNPGSTQIAAMSELTDLLYKTEVLIINKSEAKEILRVLNREPNDMIRLSLEKLCALGPKQVIITAGIEGAYLITCENNEAYHADIMKFEAIDTVGTGDTFGATYTAGLILDKDPEEALRMAIINSGAVTREWGAQRGLMKLDEIESLVEKVELESI